MFNFHEVCVCLQVSFDCECSQRFYFTRHQRNVDSIDYVACFHGTEVEYLIFFTRFATKTGHMVKSSHDLFVYCALFVDPDGRAV